MRSLMLKTTFLCLVAFAASASTAAASSRQLAVFEDNAKLAQSGDAVRNATLDELGSLGVDVIKFQLPWDTVAPRTKRKPRGFDGRDPADYPGWGPYDGLVAAAKARGFQVMVAIGPPAPGWATKRRGDRSGVNRPSAREYGRYTEAAAKRYPEADIWTLWNEPNHPGFLYPQSRRGVPYAPRLYRSLVRSGVAGLRRGGSGRDRILFGELLPIGHSSTRARSNLKPLRFLRAFFCLRSDGRRTGSARLGCRRYKRITGVRGFAYHPYTRPRGPRFVEGTRDDATIRTIGRVTRMLDLARRRGRIRGRKLPVWNTEFGYQSNPPDRLGLSARLSRIPGFINEAEWMSFRNRRVASFSQYTLVDDPLGGDADRFGSWQGGLRFVSGRAKRRVYGAYRLPFFVRLLGPGAVEVWGAARPTGAGATVQVLQRRGKRAYRNLGGPIAVTNPRGYFRARFRIARAARRSYRFQSAGLKSRTAKAAVR
jgi:hypothetical protein